MVGLGRLLVGESEVKVVVPREVVKLGEGLDDVFERVEVKVEVW